MSGHGVVALDPHRMRSLEDALAAGAENLLRSAGTIGDAFASVGRSDMGTVADLGEIAAWAASARDDVVWRRAIVEDLAPPLPLPTLLDASPAELHAMAAHLAVRLGLMMQGDAPLSVDAVEGMLTELDQLIEADETMAAVFFDALGPRRSAELSRVIERAYEAEWVARRPKDVPVRFLPPMPEADALRLLSAHQRAMGALVVASGVEGSRALGDDWIAGFTGIPVDADIELSDEQQATTDEVLATLNDIGLGAKVARPLAQAAGLERAAVVVGAAGTGATVVRGLIGIATAPAVLIEADGLHCDVPQAAAQLAAGALGLVTVAASGPAGVIAVVGAGIFAGATALLSKCGRGPSRYAPGNSNPRYNPGTGTYVHPGGSETNEWSTGTGQALPYNMAR